MTLLTGSGATLSRLWIARLDGMWQTNFGITNRYEMPLKSSV